VVDDLSPDGTAAEVDLYRMTNVQSDSSFATANSGEIRCLVRHEERGLGSAIRAAMQAALDDGYELFCNLDADLSHDPADLSRLIEELEQNNTVDVAIGSRYVTGGNIVGWPAHRKWMSRVVNSFARRMLRLPVRDASGSLRCYRVESLGEVRLSSEDYDGYAFLQQVLLRMHRNGASMVELPITFTERVHGKSKLSFREAFRSCRTLLKMTFARP